MGEGVFRSDGRTLLMVAHGTRAPAGVQTVNALAAAVAVEVGPVRTAFVDVLGPTPAEVLARARGQAVVVPAFLASGYHVRTDLPSHIVGSGHRDTVVTATLGPDPELAAAMLERLREAGWLPGDAVVMAAAGSSDDLAQAELHDAAALLDELVGDVHVGYIATGTPTVTDVVAQARATGVGRVVVAPYLLAPGRFHERLATVGADAVAAPLGVHPRVVALLSARFRAGIADGRRRRCARPGHPSAALPPGRFTGARVAASHRGSTEP